MRSRLKTENMHLEILWFKSFFLVFLFTNEYHIEQNHFIGQTSRTCRFSVKKGLKKKGKVGREEDGGGVNG